MHRRTLGAILLALLTVAASLGFVPGPLAAGASTQGGEYITVLWKIDQEPLQGSLTSNNPNIWPQTYVGHVEGKNLYAFDQTLGCGNFQVDVYHNDNGQGDALVAAGHIDKGDDYSAIIGGGDGTAWRLIANTENCETDDFCYEQITEYKYQREVPGVPEVKEYRFRVRTELYGEKEIKEINGYDFGGNGTTRIDDTIIPGRWFASPGWHTIPDVVVNIVWGVGGIPDSVLGTGNVPLSAYGWQNYSGNNAYDYTTSAPSVPYNAHKITTDEGFSDWSAWSEWSTVEPGLASNLLEREQQTQAGTGTPAQTFYYLPGGGESTSLSSANWTTDEVDTQVWTQIKDRTVNGERIPCEEQPQPRVREVPRDAVDCETREFVSLVRTFRIDFELVDFEWVELDEVDLGEVETLRRAATATELANYPCLTMRECPAELDAFVTYDLERDGWDLSGTRATGHNELVDNGLRVWTEGNTTTDKAAGFQAVNFPLADVGEPSIDYTATSGTVPPGIHISIDFDSDGDIDGTIIGEADFYGDNWWLNGGAAQFVIDGAPHTGGGQGSPYYGTLPEWLNAFPDATVLRVGYSLGSGVLGDGVINSLTVGCTIYTFDAPTPVSEPDYDISESCDGFTFTFTNEVGELDRSEVAQSVTYVLNGESIVVEPGETEERTLSGKEGETVSYTLSGPGIEGEESDSLVVDCLDEVTVPTATVTRACDAPALVTVPDKAGLTWTAPGIAPGVKSPFAVVDGLTSLEITWAATEGYEIEGPSTQTLVIPANVPCPEEEPPPSTTTTTAAPPAPAETLPKTGSATESLLIVAAFAIGMGALLVGASKLASRKL